MLCQLVEYLLDKRVVSHGGGTGTEAREPGRALAVVGEQAMDVGADDAPVGRHRTFRRSIGEASERPRAVGTFAEADMHFVACEKGAIARFALHGLEPLVSAQHGLDLEQAEPL